MVGDVMVDSFAAASRRSSGSLPAQAREHPGYVLLTLHRPSNVDDPARLGAWLAAVADWGPVLFPVHPRTRVVLNEADVAVPATVVLMEPVGYLAMVALEREARVVATDSGGVQKEAYLSGAPCVTLRAETEWVETLDTGWNRLCPEPADLSAAMVDADGVDRSAPRPALFGDGHAAERIVAALERLTAVHQAALVAS